MARQYLKLSREDDPRVVPELIEQNEESVARLPREAIALKSGDDVFAFIIEDHRELTDIMFEPRSVASAFLGIQSVNWVNKHMNAWLGVKNAADAVGQSADHNVVAAMGLDLLDVSDVVRQYPAVVHYFAEGGVERDTFFTGLADLDGGDVVRRGHRGVPAQVRHALPRRHRPHQNAMERGPDAARPAHHRQHQELPARRARAAAVEQGRADAERSMNDLLDRLRSKVGCRKAKKAARQMSLVRHSTGYRKILEDSLPAADRYGLYKQALMGEARKLVAQGVIKEPEDVYFLSLEEFRQVARTGVSDASLITARRAAHEDDRALTPPRVMTSEGEVISGEYDAGSRPAGALAGTAVSAGVVEGRARVVLNMEDAEIEPGDIVVTVFTDPSWSALFVSVAAVVMEIGGVMTHGAVIAREYGLPAVVGVEGATRRIADGQRIRVNGSEGYVEILDPEPPAATASEQVEFEPAAPHR